MRHSSHKEQNEVEELRSAILNYTKTIKDAETKKITHYNQLYLENLQKKVKLREEHKLAYAKSMISPGIYTINIGSIYDLLRKVSQVYEVSLNIIPTLFLPQPATYLFTNSQGRVQISESSDYFSRFFAEINNQNQKYSCPVCIFKRTDKRIKLFLTVQNAQSYLVANPAVSGIMQHFIMPTSDKMSICKVLQKNQKFKYFLVINKQKSYVNNKPSRLRSMSNTKLSKDNNASEIIKKKRQESVKVIRQVPEKFCSSLLERLQLNVKTPRKISKKIKLQVERHDLDKFIVIPSSLSNCYVNSVKITYSEVEKMMQTILALIKKFFLHEKVDISECFCEFIRNTSKQWLILNCNQIRISSGEIREIHKKESETVVTTKADTESEGFEEATNRLEELLKTKEQGKRLS